MDYECYICYDKIFLFVLSASKSNSCMSVFIIVCTGRTLLIVVIGTRVSIAKPCDHKAHHVITLLNDGIAPLPSFSKNQRSLRKTQAIYIQANRELKCGVRHAYTRVRSECCWVGEGVRDSYKAQGLAAAMHWRVWVTYHSDL